MSRTQERGLKSCITWYIACLQTCHRGLEHCWDGCGALGPHITKALRTQSKAGSTKEKGGS
eukprot:10175331-Heterocapsa_arctica.AAC.1